MLEKWMFFNCKMEVNEQSLDVDEYVISACKKNLLWKYNGKSWNLQHGSRVMDKQCVR